MYSYILRAIGALDGILIHALVTVNELDEGRGRS